MTQTPENSEPSKPVSIKQAIEERFGNLLSKVPTKTPEEIAEYDRRRRHAEKIQRENAFDDLVNRIGSRYEDASLDSFECVCQAQRDVLDAVKKYAELLGFNTTEGRGFLAFGPPGTGKDHLLVSLMRIATVECGMDVHWINGLDLYGEVRDRIGDDENESKLIERLASPEILAISDPLPPWGPLSAFQSQILFRVIDKRYRFMRPTWATLNVTSGKDASERMGASIVDRLKHNALSVFCNWASYRGSETRKDQSP